jgi:hypothetical protein
LMSAWDCKSRKFNFCNQFIIQQNIFKHSFWIDLGVSANSSIFPAIFSSIAPGHELFRCWITSSRRDFIWCMHWTRRIDSPTKSSAHGIYLTTKSTVCLIQELSLKHHTWKVVTSDFWSLKNISITHVNSSTQAMVAKFKAKRKPACWTLNFEMFNIQGLVGHKPEVLIPL